MRTGNSIRLNLQLFAEGEGAPATLSVETPPPAEPLKSAGDYWERDNVVQPPGPAPAQPVEPVQPPQIDNPQPSLILGKYADQGELVKAYQNLQGTYTKDHQALLEAQKIIEAERTAKTDLETRIQTLSQPPVQPDVGSESADEFDGLDAEAYAQKFYEDPKAFTRKIEDRAFARAEKAFNEKLGQIESKFNPVVETVQTQQHTQLWSDAATKFRSETPDAAEFVDGMKQYIAENNLSDSKNPEKVLRDAYIHARGMQYQPSQTVDPKSYLQDPAFVQENILNNPAITEQIVKNYLAGIRTNQQQVPPTITGNSSSNTPAPPPPRPTSIAEATRLAASRIFGG